MNPKIKLIFLIIFSISTVFIRNLAIILPLFLSIILIVFLLKLQSKLFEWIKPILLICIFIIFLQTFTYVPIKFSLEGMIFGITISMRLLTLLTVVFTFTFTTSPREILEAFSFLPHEIAIMLMLSLRFIPLVKDEVAKIINAQKSRGLNFRSVNFFKTYFPILVPLFVKTLEGSNHLALAMESRGFEVK